MSVLPRMDGGRVHWLLLGSLALNLLFVGAAGAVAYRYTTPVALMPITRIEGGLPNRFESIADSLPPADADVMRAELHVDAAKIAAARADMRRSQEQVRRSLRAEPFDVDAMRAAMAANHDAHARFDAVIHDMLAAAASRMSVVGRDAIADWPAPRVTARLVKQSEASDGAAAAVGGDRQ